MKKLLVIILATTVILTLLAGCAKQESTSPAATTPEAAVITTPEAAVTTIPAAKTLEQPLADPIQTEDGLVSGTVIGETGHEIRVYKGIPYAAPPVGDLRWRPPQPPALWTGVRVCSEYSIGAPQQNPFAPPNFEQSEDCLYLNVQTPAKKAADKLPVMVWMHEGGYSFGSGNEPGTNLPGLVQHGVLLVTVNMRLSALGLLAHPLLSKESPNGVSGNYMFLDMIAALEWVRDNIAAFGGDPGNVTIFGESGGGAKVAELMASPLAKDLFHKAIMESAAITGESFIPDVPLKDAEALGQKLFATLGVDQAADPLAAARALPWKDIMTKLAGTYLTATVDGWILPDATANIFKAGGQNPVPFITVANLGEITGPGLLLFPNLIPGYTNMLANAGKAGIKGYAAIFEHVPANWKADGAVTTHLMEVPYVFGDMDSSSGQWATVYALAAGAGAKQADPGLSREDRQLSENIMEMWTQFAQTGNPDIAGLVQWPAYEAASDQYLALDEPLSVKSGFSLIAPKPASPIVTPIVTPSTSPKPDAGFDVKGTNQRTDLISDGPPVVENGKYMGKGTIHYEFHGSLEGELISKHTLEVNMVDGKVTIAGGEATFKGTVEGKKGTFTASETASGQMSSSDTGVIWVTYEVISGTDDLAALSGTFIMTSHLSSTGEKGDFVGKLRFGETPAPVSTPLMPATPADYSWEEAVNHIGVTATVTGPIIDSKDLASMGYDYIVLGMGKPWGEPGYVGIALRVDRATISLGLYIGKTISATGRIYRTLSGAAVEITDLAQIQIK